MRSFCRIAVALLALGTGLAQEPAGRKIYPADESHLDPSFGEFKVNLLKAIEEQDRGFLRSALTPGVSFHFEAPIPADSAMAVFDENDGAFWEILHRLLLMGVERVKDGRFIAPYLFYAIGRTKGFDRFTNMVITDRDVELYAEPKPNASVIALLSYDIVEFDRSSEISRQAEQMIDGERWSWYKISTIPNEQTGYIRRKYGYTTFSDRVIFAQHEGEWKLTAFMGGD